LDELKLVNRAAIAACDANDGVRDGLIGDPRRCAFDAAQLACSNTRQAQRECLSEQQVKAFRKIYAGAKHPRTGEQIFAGLSKGSEALGNDASQSWRTYLLDPPRPMRSEALGYFLFHDPNWDWRTVDVERDLAFADRELSFMDATAKDLSPFARRGGKLILYTGWADPVAPAMDTIRYYEGVASTMGGLAKTQEFARLFVAPGMGHCGGGPGPNQFDALGALDRWLTTGEAPARLLATHESDGKVDRSRPLCPYPQVARYKGAGSIDDAANFTCAAPAP
jgi:feruloyl esterase